MVKPTFFVGMNVAQIFLLCLGIACILMLFGAKCGQKADPAAPPAPPSARASVDVLPYDLAAPALTINLASEDLREISALSPTSEPGVFLAVADERGEVFFIDSGQKGTITKRIAFREKGDFEGVEMVGDRIFCLKSSGVVFEITNWKDGKPKVQEYPTSLNKDNDLEGLGYDSGRQALLLACKENPESDVARRIFAFDINTRQLAAAPVYAINPREVNERVPYNDFDKAQNFFSPSGIAVHPITQDVYVISTSLKRLVVLDHSTGQIRLATRLDRRVLPQPEGISFDTAGHLYISSEGKKGEGMILKFLYRGG